MPARVIPVRLPASGYDIVTAPDSLAQLGHQMAERGLQDKVLVVSNPQIFQHYGSRVMEGLSKADFRPHHCLLPAGERYKTLRSVEKIYDAALTAGLERSSTILALGGGVIGDMAGFAAATWLRGINVVQVPTTLLAMVDAAIGGKTGVNHPNGKNLIGAFHQPRLVWIDPTVLGTLPAREFRAALAEVIKYGVIQAPDLFAFLEDLPKLQRFRDLPAEALERIVGQSAQCKADVVQQDEREGGLRAILNYGHTVGHAVESVTRYRLYRHGEAVALGMEAAARLAEALGWWSASETQRQHQLLIRAGLPVTLPAHIDLEAVVRGLHSDKKVQAGKVRFILPKALGQVEITSDVGDRDVLSVLNGMQVAATSE